MCTLFSFSFRLSSAHTCFTLFVFCLVLPWWFMITLYSVSQDLSKWLTHWQRLRKPAQELSQTCGLERSFFWSVCCVAVGGTGESSSFRGWTALWLWIWLSFSDLSTVFLGCRGLAFLNSVRSKWHTICKILKAIITTISKLNVVGNMNACHLFYAVCP